METSEITIRGERVLLEDGEIRPAALHVAGGVIRRLTHSAPANGSRTIDAGPMLLLPGIVDLHGDAFERQLTPRRHVHMPSDLALLETDHQMIANGITTAYHGLTVTWQPGDRSPEAGLRFMEAFDRVRPALACDTRLHLRHEVISVGTASLVEGWLAAGKVDLLAFNDHISLITSRLNDPARLARYAFESGVSVDEFRRLLAQALERKRDVPRTTRRLAAAAVERRVPMASHDDETPQIRRWYRELDCTICEFPANRETAEEARQVGDPVVMGAPNVVRGASHCHRLTAAESVREGLCTVLSSDYYYPSVLHAPFRLADQGMAAFPDAWNLVARNAAQAVGLTDRGVIAEGRRADLVLVDDSMPLLPRVMAVLVNGRLSYCRTGLQ